MNLAGIPLLRSSRNTMMKLMMKDAKKVRGYGEILNAFIVMAILRFLSRHLC